MNKKLILDYVNCILNRAINHSAFDENAFEQNTISNVKAEDGTRYDLQGDEADWTLTAIEAKIITERMKQIFDYGIR